MSSTPTWNSPTSFDVGLVRGLGQVLAEALPRADFFLLLWQGGASTKASLASREERPHRGVRARGVLVEDPVLPGLVWGLVPERQPTVKDHQSCRMEDLMDRTLVDVSSWLACVTGD